MTELQPSVELFALNSEVAVWEAALPQAEAGSAARLQLLLLLAWHLRQRHSARALELAQQARQLLAALPVPEVARLRIAARLDLVEAEVHWLFARPLPAEQGLLRALAAFEAAADRAGMADARSLHVSICSDAGRPRERDELLEQCLADCRAAGDPQRLAVVLARRLLFAAFRDARAAGQSLAQTEELQGEHGPGVLAGLASVRAVVAGYTGELGASIGHFMQAYEAAQATGQLRFAVLSASNGADSFASLGDLDAALEWDERALQLARACGWPAMLGLALTQIGHVLRLLGRLGDARENLLAALPVMSGLTGSANYAMVLQALGELQLDLGDAADALQQFERAEACAAALGEPIAQLRSWRGQADALGRLGRPEQALHKIEAALSLVCEQGNVEEQIKVLRVMAELHRSHSLPAPPGMRAASACLHFLQQAQAAAATIAGFSMPSELLDELARACADAGEHRLAYQHAVAAGQARDSRLVTEGRNRAIALQVRQDTQRAHAEAELQRQLAQTEARRAQALLETSQMLEALGHIGREITACLDADAVFASLHRHVHRLLDASFFGVCLLDETQRSLRLVFGVENGTVLPTHEVSLDALDSSFARCAREREPVLIDLPARDEAGSPIPGTLATLSLMFFPLLSGERLLGVMSVQSPHVHAYGERERSIMQALCGYGAIALDNARAYRQLEAATAAKSQFLAHMSHEIRTPMNAVLGMLQLLQNTELDARQLDYAGKASGAARSLLGLINDILDFSKIEANKMVLEPQPFALAQLLAELSAIISAQAGAKAVALCWQVDAAVPPVLLGDALRLQQVLINLLSNALKFTERGEVRLEIRLLELNAGLARLYFGVQDSGIGIAPEHQQRIFEGFSQAEASTTRRFGGTGLGLSICRRLVQLMGGELSLHSRVGEGSCFAFELSLPVADAQTPSAQTLQPASAHGLQGLRLLLVEDNDLNQQVAMELLSAAGASVTLAVNGQLALDRLRAQPGDAPEFDAVLMDLQMPVMDGFAATRLIRAQAPAGLGLSELPIIAMTANAMDSDREACRVCGMNDHVGKPFEMSELSAKLLHWCGRAAPAVEAPESREETEAEAEPQFIRLLLPPELQQHALAWGLDAQALMDRFMGKAPLYLRLVSSFHGKAAALPAQLAELLDQGLLAEAELALHSLKGLAATLGADALAALAAEGETCLKQGQAPEPGWAPRLMVALANDPDWLLDLAQRLAALHAAAQAAPSTTAIPPPSDAP